MLNAKMQYAIILINELRRKEYINNPANLKDIAKDCELKLEFLEKIAGQLKRKNLLRATRGPGGGYNISSEYVTIGDLKNALQSNYELKVVTQSLRHQELVLKIEEKYLNSFRNIKIWF